MTQMIRGGTMLEILIVDDDTNILDLLSIQLSKSGFRVTKATDGLEALHRLKQSIPDLAIVDVMMPNMDGFTLTKKIRASYDIPVLLLTAKGELADKEQGFLAGSDDYLVKPFEPKELLFRIRAILRRYEKSVDTFIQVGSMTINRERYEVIFGQKTLFLPLKEFDLLSVLASRPNQVFTREILLERVWGYDYDGDDQTLNTHIRRLREKLKNMAQDITIQTVRGVGYKLEVRK